MNKIQTLADFKRLPVGTELTLHSTSMQDHKYLGKTRKIEKMQTNGFRFEGGSWLYFPKATDFEIDKDLILIKDEREAGFYLAYNVGQPL